MKHGPPGRRATRAAAATLVAATLVAAVLAGCRSGTDPARLAVGDCFDLPAATDSIGAVTKRTCTEPHRGEVFHLFEAAPAGGAYPTDADWELLIYAICDPVFETYTGTPVATRLDIAYLYLVPTAERWSSGDRRVTCFISSLDGAPLTKSQRAP